MQRQLVRSNEHASQISIWCDLAVIEAQRCTRAAPIVFLVPGDDCRIVHQSRAIPSLMKDRQFLRLLAIVVATGLVLGLGMFRVSHHSDPAAVGSAAPASAAAAGAPTGDGAMPDVAGDVVASDAKAITQIVSIEPPAPPQNPPPTLPAANLDPQGSAVANEPQGAAVADSGAYSSQ